MKPTIFENLRRLVSGNQKKNEKESSFRRSDSFKRISIRKSYLNRGKKKHISKLEVATQTVTEVDLCNISKESKKANISVQFNDKVDLNYTTKSTSRKESQNNNNRSEVSKSESGQSVIAYGHWLKGIRKDDVPSPSGIKGSERTVIYVPASDETALSPVIQQLPSSPIFRKKSPISKRRVKPVSPNLQRKESSDSAVEMFPWGNSTDVKKSSLIRKQSRQSLIPLMPDSGTEEMCSLSISLGRIWMDTQQAVTPRGLEMPKTSAPTGLAHHSLDSVLKDLRDDSIVINRLQQRSIPPVARTLSSTSNTTVSTGLFSSKDSGFSFSISEPKLSDFYGNSTLSYKKCFFRKNKPKPKLSVSRDGYFKRTNGMLVVDAKRSSVYTRSSSKKKGSKNKNTNKGTIRSDLYQVVVNRPLRSLRDLKLDPMIFVLPEKRKTSATRKPSYKLKMHEIRNFSSYDTSLYSTRSVNDSANDSLYEEFDDLSDKQPLNRHISCINLRDDDIDFDLPSRNFAHVTPVFEESTASELFSAEASEDSSSDCVRLYVPPGVSPVLKRKPVRRKKLTLSHKRSITYVVKPTIIRAPSTLRKPTKKLGELEQRSLATATFVKQVDQLFDSFNGSRALPPDGKELKCCITDHSAHLPYWKKAFTMVKRWQYCRITKTGSLKPSKPPSQIGWLTSLNGIRQIWEYLHLRGVTSLRPRSLNQDALENLFEAVRGGCGSGDNPTAVQFSASLKTQILNGLLRHKIVGQLDKE